jgi:cytochrome P450
MLNALPPNCHPQLVLTMIAQRYNLPPIFYLDLWPFGPAQMVLSEPDAMSQVTTLRAYPKHDMSGQFVRPMVGDNNIVAANGPLWKFLHTLMAPAFTPGYVKSMIGVITDETTRFHATLASFADTGEAFSMEDTCAALIFDIIGRTTIGFSFKAQEGGSEILADLRDVVVYDSLRRLSWNPITKLSAYFKRRFAYQRSDRYIARWILHRYDALKGKGNLSARQAVTSILDRFLIEKLQQNEAIGREEQTMDPNFLQLTISK